MLRNSVLFLLLMFVCGKVFANINVELDVVFNDSTVQCRYLYVLIPNTKGTNDTLAAFDTLSFCGQNRVSLFYSVGSAGKNILSMADSVGVHVESKPFRVSPHHNDFLVAIGRQYIDVTGNHHLFPQKNEDERSYYIFLLIFFAVKILIATIFIFVSELPGRNISIAAGTFLLSAFVDWLLPVNYLYRFLLTMLAEYLLIAFAGRKFISRLRAAQLVLVVNTAGYGMIAFMYLIYVFL